MNLLGLFQPKNNFNVVLKTECTHAHRPSLTEYIYKHVYAVILVVDGYKHSNVRNADCGRSRVLK